MNTDLNAQAGYIQMMKKLTVGICMFWLAISSGYSAVLLGTLAHELIHKENGVNVTAITINFDGSGETRGAYFRNHSHERVYLDGYIIESTLLFINLFSIMIIYGGKKC